MNDSGYPEKLDISLEYGYARVVKFNRKGTLLAVGTGEGLVVVWDFSTRSVAKILQTYSKKPVTRLSWSRNSRMLLSCGDDFRVIRLNIETTIAEKVMKFPSKLTYAQIHPTKHNLAIVYGPKVPPTLIDFDVIISGPTETPNEVKSSDTLGEEKPPDHIYKTTVLPFLADPRRFHLTSS